MKIAIVSSSVFVKEMYEYMNLLTALGHEVSLHEHYIRQAKGEMANLVERMHKEHSVVKKENDYIRYHYKEIVESDAILVLNFDKNGINNYIGGNSLMEIGFAHVHNKKIFLLNPVPEISYRAEIEATSPVIINGDIKKIV